jgi:hypothetical protein
MSESESQERGRLTVRLGKTHLYLLPDLIILPVLLLIFPTLDAHSNSFVSTT